jgi:hypothetical protein
MHFTTATMAAILATVASASPLAEIKPHCSGGVVRPINLGPVDQPINPGPVARPDPVVNKTVEGSITRRTPKRGIVQPIQPDPVVGEDMEGSITKRDARLKCGGNRDYVPVNTFNAMAESYCTETTGVDIAEGYEHTDSYEVYLTNQKNPEKQGALGRIICKSF